MIPFCILWAKNMDRFIVLTNNDTNYEHLTHFLFVIILLLICKTKFSIKKGNFANLCNFI